MSTEYHSINTNINQGTGFTDCSHRSALRIVNQYLVPGVENEINVSDFLRKGIRTVVMKQKEKEVPNIPSNVFSRCLMELHTLLKMGEFQEFLSSEIYPQVYVSLLST